MARFASAISAADICSKSRCCRTSRSEKVRVASISTSGGSSSAFGASPGRAAGVLQAAAELLLVVGIGRHADRRQQQLHHLFEQPRVAPEDVEGLVEDLALVAAVHEHRVQRPVEVVAFLEAGRLDRLDGASTWPGPTRRPAVRSARAKWTMLSASMP